MSMRYAVESVFFLAVFLVMAAGISCSSDETPPQEQSTKRTSSGPDYSSFQIPEDELPNLTTEELACRVAYRCVATMYVMVQSSFPFDFKGPIKHAESVQNGVRELFQRPDAAQGLLDCYSSIPIEPSGQLDGHVFAYANAELLLADERLLKQMDRIQLRRCIAAAVQGYDNRVAWRESHPENPYYSNAGMFTGYLIEGCLRQIAPPELNSWLSAKQQDSLTQLRPHPSSASRRLIDIGRKYLATPPSN